ncbi:MAG: phosphohistidine phosphatase SixA [Methylococcales bacterium]|nr:phosphohistidine phosphatase SixA [Methylococcales bacterium]
MALYLVQHGQCLDKEVDPNRSLSSEGRATIMQVAKTAKNEGITVSTIYHSGKLRALQTAELFSGYLKSIQLESVSGLSPLDSVKDLADHFQLTDKTMIVGHLPFLERLTSYLITGNQNLIIVKFQHAGIVCLDQDKTNHWYLKWTIMPVIN